MTFYVQRQVPQQEGTTFLYHSNPASALNRFAAANLHYKAKRRRHWWGRKVPSVTDMNAAQEWLVKGDGMVEMSKAAGEISERERRISQTTSTLGALAGPGALYAAFKAAKANQGSWPRDVSRAATNRLPKNSPARKKALRIIASLDKPTSSKAKAAALGLGAGMVGLQTANVLGDTITARAMSGAKKVDE
jgi:hypothetical protein